MVLLPIFRIAHRDGEVESVLRGMICVAGITLVKKVFKNLDPDVAIPTQPLPVLQRFSIRRELECPRVIAEGNIHWQTEVRGCYAAR
jgi:hypothetical protein